MIKKYALLLLLFIPVGIYAQTAVRGAVTDDLGPLPGVSVVVEGTTRGTTTDFDGNYQIEANTGDVLVFSYIGKRTQKIRVTGTTLNVIMQEDATQLQEVIVEVPMGYGSIADKDRASAIDQVGVEGFNQGVVASPDQLVKGRISGVQIIDNGGAPGEGSSIRIRGGSSISATNNPLIIIDDVPLDINGVGGTRNFLNALNPNDIETFTVLKDASATAIYGFRASNGVIIITTKKGRSGQERIKVNYNGNVAFAQIADRVNVLSADQFRSFVNNYGTPEQIALLGNANTDWQDVIFRDAITHNHNINVTGSLENILNYRVSAGFTDQEGILQRDNLKRSTLSINLNTRLFDNLKIEANTKLSLEDYFYANGGAIGAAVTFDPTQPVYQNNAYGNYFQWLEDRDDPNSFPLTLAGKNPLGLLEQQDSEGTVFRTIG
ncbi:MAG: carboxypeptidase-like regulatory domain-containing protein, partial [Bacteroidota bacterium]